MQKLFLFFLNPCQHKNTIIVVKKAKFYLFSFFVIATAQLQPIT